MRGEYNWRDATLSILGELPPRARRILYAPLPTSVCLGTTSACAENTCDLCDSAIPNGNYLRVRGEYFAELSHGLTTRELPPRARRIRPSGIDRWAGDGTTSACAENTVGLLGHLEWYWNYLRVRGEYEGPGGSSERLVELPPRARRIREWLSGVGDTIGTTSACAENTRRLPGRKARIWNYLRVRGEYSEPLRIAPHNPELPPRARRIQPACCARSIVQGTTSACAENTRLCRLPRGLRRNYLRVRGEYTPLTIFFAKS